MKSIWTRLFGCFLILILCFLCLPVSAQKQEPVVSIDQTKAMAAYQQIVSEFPRDGDSGGPVYMKTNSMNYLVGSISGGNNSAHYGKLVYYSPIYYPENDGFTVKTN